MKPFVFFTLFFCSMHLLSQETNLSLLEDKQWMLLRADESKCTYISNPKDVTDKFTIAFNKDGTFTWNSNPSCGTRIGAASGTGSWEYRKSSGYLVLDFKNVMLDGGEKRGMECYKIDSITNNTLAISQLKQCGKK